MKMNSPFTSIFRALNTQAMHGQLNHPVAADVRRRTRSKTNPPPHVGGDMPPGLTLALLLSLAIAPANAMALGQTRIVEHSASPGSFPLVRDGAAAPVYVDANDWPGVVRVANDLRADVQRVTRITPALATNGSSLGKHTIIVGTIGKSRLVDQLIREKKIDVTGITDKWEATLIQVVPNALPGVESALVIAGSDKRGTTYGVYDLSEQIGVSPWYWWADVPSKQHDALFVKAGRHVQGPPAVQYRGIFLNDEAPALSGWTAEKFGGMNHKFYTNVFELILRLKGNFLWPAMWNNSFATDDPVNARLADEYGIVISTSHHEPMMRAWKEWERAGNRKGSWDYSRNAENLRKFWAEGIGRTKDYEKIITLAMRGDGDEPMSETDSVALLEQVVADQRKQIAEIINTNLAEVPQVWALYKEVQAYYEKGMRVPDDVILLWCDDNWGNIRRLPTAEERKRSGGAGVYYHFDYVGGPRNYKWLNVTPISKIWEQMNLAYHHDANRLWVVNVGDLKPMEFPIEFFLTMAWNPDAWPKERIAEFTKLWATREFGPEYAADIADIVAKYTKYNRRRTPELLEPGTFSLENYSEADRVLAEWKTISDKAETINAKLPANARDAFFQLVLYPTKACYVVNDLYISAAKNRFYAKHNDGRANEYAQRVRDLFAQDAALTRAYHRDVANGKWNHMMAQTRIGYTYWQQPPSNTMPGVVEVTNAVAAVDLLGTPYKRIEPQVELPQNWQGFVEADGYVSMEAAHFTRKTDAGGAAWEVIEDLGRTLSSVSIFPVTAPSVTPPQNSPVLEYDLYLTSTGTVEVASIIAPSLNFSPDRGVRIAVSFDDEAPQLLTVMPKGYFVDNGVRDWEESVRTSCRVIKSKHTITQPGPHTLKFWMVDAGVLLQKLVVDTGGVKPSYLGPPESYRKLAGN